MLALAAPAPGDSAGSYAPAAQTNAYGRPVAYEKVFQGSMSNSRATH